MGVDGFVESDDPKVVNVEIVLDRLPQAFDNFTVAQLSDFHYQEHLSSVPISKAVRTINRLHPELVVLTGDFVTVPTIETPSSMRHATATAIPCAALLQQIVGSKYAIMGNHDAIAQPTTIIGDLRNAGIPVLRNGSTPIERGSDRIWLAGIDDLLKGRPNLDATLRGIPPSDCTILLAHEPDFADYVVSRPVDLQLSGHSHGGQVWIPGIGAPWLPPMGRKYPRGLHRVGNLVLYTNIGIGTIRAPIRINCPPEITLITLRSRQTARADAGTQAIRNEPNKL